MTKEDNIRAILETHFAGFREDLIESAVKMIMRLEVRHGRWENIYSDNYKCSVCGAWYRSDEPIDFVYCPNCGALMNGE